MESYGDRDSYLDLIGRDRLAELARTETAFLLDPYRPWILSPDDVARLTAKGDAQ